jgi:hypothetical protein
VSHLVHCKIKATHMALPCTAALPSFFPGHTSCLRVVATNWQQSTHEKQGLTGSCCHCLHFSAG